MNDTTLSRGACATTPKPHFLDGLAQRAVRARLTRLEHGSLTVVDGVSVSTYGRASERCSLAARIEVHDARFWSELAFGGSIGAGEAYMQAYWSVDDLTGLVRILLHNRAVLDGLETGLARMTGPQADPER